ncbi:MAG: hypothetical protein ABI780_07865 [Ardenticatenales bacterium]
MISTRRLPRGLVTLALTVALARVGATRVDTAAPDGGQADRTCAGPVAFHAARVDPVFLPALDGPPAGPACDAVVHVQNVGDRPGRVMLWLWGPPGDCFVDCRPPLAVLCSGLIGAGATWAFDRSAASWPEGTVSGVVFSLAATASPSCRALVDGDGGGRPTDDAGPPSCGAYRRFRSAWDDGAAAGDVALSTVYGPPIVAHVLRRCPTAANKLIAGTGAYEGVGGRYLAGFDRVAWVGTYVAPVVAASARAGVGSGVGGGGGVDTWLTVQNAGGCCAAIEIWFQSRDACQPDALCLSATIPAGASLRYRAGDCRTGPGDALDGSAWIRGSEPLGVVVDMVGADEGTSAAATARAFGSPGDAVPSLGAPDPSDGLASYVAPPADLRPSFRAQPVFTAGSPVLFGPWVRGGAGARSRLTVQNMAVDRSATVRLTVRAAGLVVSAHATVCPRGSVTWDTDRLAPLSELPGDWTGDVRVESIADPAVDEPPPNLVGLVRTSMRSIDRRSPADVDGGNAAGAVAYELLTVPPIGRAKAATRLVALPDVGGSIVVADLSGGVGGTAFGLFLFDANGLVAVRCQRLPPFGSVQLNVGVLGGRGAPFRGAALVSAASWSPGGPGIPFRLDGGSLAAIALDNTAADDARGDAWTASAGIPLPLDTPILRLLGAEGPLACARERVWGGFHVFLPALLQR